MNKIFAIVTIVVGGILAAPCGSQAVTARLSDDAYTTAANPANNGKKTTLKIQDAANDLTSWVRFDLSALSGGNVESATLRIYLQKVSKNGSFEVVAVASSWDEESIAGIGAPGVGAVIATVTVPVPPANPTRYDYINVDITSTVQGWINTPATNFGLALVPVGGSAINVQLDSKESTSTSQGPVLEVALVPQISSADIDFSTASGFGNTASGTGALSNNELGDDNTANGYAALSSNWYGFSNTASGSYALYSNTEGSYNTASGSSALRSNTTGSTNTAMGHNALSSNTIGGSNVGVGYGALDANIDGSSNVAVGKEALWANTAGSANVAVGREALYSTTTGSSNVGVGYSTLSSNTTGSFNIAAGRLSLAANTTGASNVAMGYSALASNTTANDNTAVGDEALDANTTGTANVAVGSNALGANTTASNNTALGTGALTANTTGASNVAVGQNALAAVPAGSNNTAIGLGALDDLTSGGTNIAIGSGAGNTHTSGSFNIYIGSGSAGSTTESSTLRIGNTPLVADAYIAGIFGNTPASSSTVVVNSSGQLGTLPSSRRYKTDIRDVGKSSSALLRLRPVSFRYRPEKDPSGELQFGLIAEEVAAVMPSLVVYGADGKPETVRYHVLSALLLNELQKQERTQQAQHKMLREQQESLREQQESLRAVRIENAELRAQMQRIDALQARLIDLETERPAKDLAAAR